MRALFNTSRRFTVANHRVLKSNLTLRRLVSAVTPAENIPENLKIEDKTIFTEEASTKDFKLTSEYYLERKPESGRIYTDLYSFINPTSSPLEQVKLSDRVFGSDVRLDIISQVVRWQRANRRQGTHLVKTISERSGTGKKPHPQKKTGAARQGSKRAPHMRKGGRVHGPILRDHSHKLNKKVRRFGMRSVLAAKYIEHNFMVVDTLKQPSEEEGIGRMKTRTIYNFLKTHNWQKANIMFVDDRYSPHLELAVRNLPQKIKVCSFISCNVYDMLRLEKVVITLDALRKLEARLE